jgi:hypothetical protein
MLSLIMFIVTLIIGFVSGKLNERTTWKLNCNKTYHKDLLCKCVNGKRYFIFDFDSLTNVIDKVPESNPAYKEIFIDVNPNIEI